MNVQGHHIFSFPLPYGEEMATQKAPGDFSSRYKFNGKELDEETGLYYYGARYYDPKVSLWLSVDPLAEKYPSLSPYTYTYDNPIVFVDPTGMAGMKNDDWYKDKVTGDIVWIEGSGKQKGYEHLGYNYTENLGEGFLIHYDGNSQTRSLYYNEQLIEVSYSLPVIVIDAVPPMNLWDELKPVPRPVYAPFFPPLVPNAILPDYVSVGVSQSSKAYVGSGTSFELTHIRRGRDPGLYFSPSVDGYAGAGIHGDISFYVKFGYYLGNRNAFRYQYLQGYEIGGIGEAGAVENVSVSVGYAMRSGGLKDKFNKPGFITFGASYGGGLGAFGGGYINYTPKLIPIYRYKK